MDDEAVAGLVGGSDWFYMGIVVFVIGGVVLAIVATTAIVYGFWRFDQRMTKLEDFWKYGSPNDKVAQTRIEVAEEALWGAAKGRRAFLLARDAVDNALAHYDAEMAHMRTVRGGDKE